MVGVRGFELLTSCSQSRRATGLRYTPTETLNLAKSGSTTWTRTRDPVINSHLLYQLSYRGTIDFRFNFTTYRIENDLLLTSPISISSTFTLRLYRCVHVSEARYSTRSKHPVNPLNCFEDNDLRFFFRSPFRPDFPAFLPTHKKGPPRGSPSWTCRLIRRTLSRHRPRYP